MKRTMINIALAGVFALTTPVLADNSTPPAQPTPMTAAQKHQMMKDCMERLKADDSSMTKDDRQTQCKKEMTMKKNGNNLDTGAMPQQATPQN
jgi:hypothetical protein